MPEDSSDISVGEQEVTQPSEPSENEMTPQQLWHSELILNANPECSNAIEDEVNEPETYEEASQNSAQHAADQDRWISGRFVYKRAEYLQTWEFSLSAQHGSANED